MRRSQPEVATIILTGFPDFDTALRFNARDANALYGRGLARQRKGDIQAGTADIAAAKAINPYIAAEFQE